MAPGHIDLLRGAAAEEMLARPVFRAGWSDLQRDCPWATPMQGPDFALTWYRAYRDHVEPVLAVRWAADGSPGGIMALALGRSDFAGVGRLAAVGDWQAEYQVWVCRPEDGDRFAAAVVAALGVEFPDSTLHLRYLPPGTPLGWLAGAAPGAVLRTHRRPLRRFGDGSEVEAVLKTKKSRTRLRAMARQGGELGFRRITSGAGLEEVLDEIVAHHDTRHAAVHGGAAFREDPCKRPFHVAMADVPGLLHVTVTTVGDRIAAAHLGALGRDTVHLGVTAHNPWLAKHSPGRWHLLLLSRMLHEEGLGELDLTPGKDGYKERFANAWDEVHTLELPLGDRGVVARLGGALRAGRSTLVSAARPLLTRLDVDPQRVRSALQPGRGARRATAAAGRTGRTGPPVREYVLGSGPAVGPPSGQDPRRDRLEDLLAYRGGDSAPPPSEFLTSALRRIAEGEHFYTRVEADRLLQVAWLARPGTGAAADRPEGTAVVHDLWADPLRCGDGAAALAAAARDAFTDGATQVVAVLDAGDSTACTAAVRAGFTRRDTGAR